MQEVLGQYKLKNILNFLVLSLDYLQRRRNPKIRWDNMLQYLLNAGLIQSELGHWISDPNGFVARTPREVEADPDDESSGNLAMPPAQSEKGQTIPQDISLAPIATGEDAVL